MPLFIYIMVNILIDPDIDHVKAGCLGTLMSKAEMEALNLSVPEYGVGVKFPDGFIAIVTESEIKNVGVIPTPLALKEWLKERRITIE